MTTCPHCGKAQLALLGHLTDCIECGREFTSEEEPRITHFAPVNLLRALRNKLIDGVFDGLANATFTCERSEKIRLRATHATLTVRDANKNRYLITVEAI